MTVNVTAVNDAPTVVNDTDSVTEGGTVIETTNSAGTVLSDDSDVDGDSLTVSGTVTQTSATANGGGSITISSPNSASVGSAVTGYYGQLTLDSDGTYSYVANQSNANALDSGESGTDVFTFTVSDGTTTTSSTITFTVNGANDAPTVVNDTDSVTEGGTVIETTNSAGTVLSDDSDVDGDSLTVSGTVTQTSATANGGGSITISSPNSASVGSAVTGYYGQLTLDSDGTYSYVANQSNANALDSGESGTDVFTFTVSDGTTTTSSTITFTVNGANDAPTASNNTVTTNEDTTYTFTASDFGFSDVDGDTLSSVTVSALSGSDGTFKLNGVAITGSTSVTKTQIDSGLLTFVPDSNENGSSYNTFTFTVNDGTTNSASSYTMTVNVTAVNDAPTVVNDTDSVTEGGTVIETTNSAGTVLSDDSDVDGDSLTVSGTVTQTSATANGGGSITISSPNSASVGSAVTGYYGQLTLDSDGTYSYVANQSNANALDSGESGTDVFTFTVSDGTTTTSSTITFTVNGANDAPTVVNDTDSVTEGGTVIETTNSAGTVLSDDSDVDGDSLTVSGTVTQTSATANGGGSITISSPNSASVGSAVTGYYGQLTLDSDGTYSYVANQSNANALDSGESGTDVFTFTVSDGTTTTSSTITFTVNGANDAPTVVNDTDSVTEGGTVIETTNSAGTVLSDDSDVDGDSLTVSGTVTQTSATATFVQDHYSKWWCLLY